MDITPEMARAELARRELARRETQRNQSQASPAGSAAVSLLPGNLLQNGNQDGFGFMSHPVENTKKGLRAIQDLTGGLMGSIQHAGALIGQGVEYPTHAAYEAVTGEKVPHYNVGELFGLEGQRPVDLRKTISHDPNSFMSSVGGILPAIAAGGASIPGQIAAQGLWGAAQANPEQKNLGGILPDGRMGAGIIDAALGGAGGLAAKYAPSLIKGAANKIKEGFNYLRPDKTAKEFLQKLGTGTKEDNLQVLAKQIQDSHQARLTDALSHKNPIFEKIGNTDIYTSPAESEFFKLAEENPDLLGGKAKKLYKQFKTNSTLDHADALQSQLGDRLGELELRKQTVGLGAGEDDMMESIKELRDILKNEMDAHISRSSPEMGEEMGKFRKKYRENVGPYLEDKATIPIVKEPRYIRQQRKENPTLPYNVTTDNLANFFSEPTRDALKVSSDLGEEGQKKILYNLLAKELNPTAAGLAKSIQSAKQAEGYARYITPEMEDLAKELIKRNKWRARAKFGAKGLAGVLGVGATEEALRRNF